MKKLIRYGVFETNSSMTHSMVILPKDVYDKWYTEVDKYLYIGDNGWSWPKNVPKPKEDTLYTEEEIMAMIGSEYDEEDYNRIDRFYSEYGFYSYESWNPDDYYYSSQEESTIGYTTKSGDEIVIRCKYGRDG